MRKCRLGFLILISSGLVGLVWWGWSLRYAKDREENIQSGFTQTIHTVSLIATGDVVMHMPIVDSAYNPADASYDFRPIFTELRKELITADFATSVLEAPLAGPQVGYHGYPQFNSPSAVADALQWAGIRLVFTAHNHALDQGIDGLKTTLTYLDEIGLSYVGTRLAIEQKRFLLQDIKGIRFAFLAYTTTTNGLKPPLGQEWMINLYDQQKITEDIAAAKGSGADCIIMALHTGKEYQREPLPEQQRMIDWLIQSGVDIVLGSHVHVVEPVEHRKIDSQFAGSKNTRDCFVAYSLGNLLSNQRWQYSDYGLMIKFVLQKNEGVPGISIIKTEYTPLWVNRYLEKGKYHYTIKKLNGPDDSDTDPHIDQAAQIRMREVWYEVKELFSSWDQKRVVEVQKGRSQEIGVRSQE